MSDSSITRPAFPQAVTLLGATGSIGTQTLDVIRQFPQRFRVSALSAGRNIERLAGQIREFQPGAVCVQAASDVSVLRALVPDYAGEILSGTEGLVALAGEFPADKVVVGLVGLSGLEPTLAALKAGRQVLTANKETFVAGGHLVAPYVERQIIPVDSEHSAIHQCLRACQNTPDTVRNLYLTASGGPFRTLDATELNNVTCRQALQHPNWVMGDKITIDSATMMNKGLEVIEARWLFNLSYDCIRVVVHPQSMIHGGVEFIDGSIIMQMGAPDMRVPIQYALTYPERLSAEYPGSRLDLLSLSRLDLEPPDERRFPCIRLAYEAGRLGGSATTALNAADEVAVKLFLQDKIGFGDIARLIEQTLDAHTSDGLQVAPGLETIRQVDAWARAFVEEHTAKLTLQSI